MGALHARPHRLARDHQRHPRRGIHAQRRAALPRHRPRRDGDAGRLALLGHRGGGDISPPRRGRLGGPLRGARRPDPRRGRARVDLAGLPRGGDAGGVDPAHGRYRARQWAGLDRRRRPRRPGDRGDISGGGPRHLLSRDLPRGGGRGARGHRAAPLGRHRVEFLPRHRAGRPHPGLHPDPHAARARRGARSRRARGSASGAAMPSARRR
jgi:hypothetical protein